MFAAKAAPTCKPYSTSASPRLCGEIILPRISGLCVKSAAYSGVSISFEHGFYEGNGEPALHCHGSLIEMVQPLEQIK